ncbi:MAG: Crp/Fnr family transcriptional regulator [Candidatus Gottesmanbacteria bacterium]|nr:Crp/Fnr family transcriptional regulator [Candidatus Gottesmanbacteria bacterium]
MDSSVTKTLETFFGKFTRLKYGKGVIILRAEDAPRGVMYLKRGYVRQYMVDESGTILMLHIFKPNSFFPMTWVVNDEPNRYYLEAVTPVELWRAPKKAVREFLHDNPLVVYDLVRRLLLGLCGCRHRIEHLVTGTAYKKTVLLLLYLARSLGEKEVSAIVLPVPVTHWEIAAWIGTTRETASLQVAILKKLGLIHCRRRQLVIPSLKRLETEIAR